MYENQMSLSEAAIFNVQRQTIVTFVMFGNSRDKLLSKCHIDPHYFICGWLKFHYDKWI